MSTDDCMRLTSWPVKAHPVLEPNCAGFLYRHLGLAWPHFECGVYRALWEASDRFATDEWHFYSLDNGGFFMAPTGVGRVRVQIPSRDFDEELSGLAAGVFATGVSLIATLGCLEVSAPSPEFVRLRAFCLTHPDAISMLCALDSIDRRPGTPGARRSPDPAD